MTFFVALQRPIRLESSTLWFTKKGDERVFMTFLGDNFSFCTTFERNESWFIRFWFVAVRKDKKLLHNWSKGDLFREDLNVKIRKAESLVAINFRSIFQLVKKRFKKKYLIFIAILIRTFSRISPSRESFFPADRRRFRVAQTIGDIFNSFFAFLAWFDFVSDLKLLSIHDY